jgi:hypothetical protein
MKYQITLKLHKLHEIWTQSLHNLRICLLIFSIFEVFLSIYVKLVDQDN